MSKKNKSKFKRQIRNQINQEMAKNLISPVVNNVINPDLKDITKKIDSETTIKTMPSLENLPQIIFDLKKTGIIVGSMVILIAGTVFYDHKFNFLLKAGDHIFKYLHIG